MNEILKKVRKARGLSQEEVAKALGINKKVYSRYETGENEMPIHRYIALADFYGVSLDYLVGRDELRNGQSGSGTSAG